ncbi:DNA-binding transcriptional LysR family regulator [Tepidamorphus gemmatus]|jgi:DNA-binding transcriptional LysR family regulator|uniref:DNA-binding transcriptional LysR family regulator n=1 Tax=Tepidamorphus gemmatus TaxID=747076 RepID=A0A4R3MA06_9HYPH|nr:LysR substrate-binding domain-containing protein [Tepidamorphus gemmatus]TCT09972.1 DNA-binding transcriptional LysR family regulator [Tepidamorphus gemmatus]
MAALIDIDLLRTFLAIAGTGSFTRAAEEVHKTQSAVSMQVKKLEDQVGRPLFDRGARQVRLTPDGLRLLDYAQRIVRLSEEAAAVFTEPALQGTVTLGVPDDYADRLLPRVLSAFARSHPHVELVVHCDQSSGLYRSIEKGELDLAIVTNCADLRSEVIRREALNFVGSQEHATHLADPLPLAVGPRTCAWRGIAQAALDSIGRRYRIAYTSPAAAALSSAVLAGLAVSILPESAIRPDMRILTERDGFPALPPCDIGFVRARQARSPIHDALAEHIVTRIGNLPSKLPDAAE